MSTTPGGTTMEMVAEPDLERLLAEVAASFPVPANGIPAVLAAVRAEEAERSDAELTRRHRRRGGRGGRGAAVAAGIAVLLIAGVGVGVTRSGGDGATATATSASVPAQSGPETVAHSFSGQGAPAAGGPGLAAGSAPQAAASAVPSAAPAGGLDAATTGGRSATTTPGSTGGATIAQRVVQTGTVGLAVAKGAVAATVDKLEAAAKGQGGYLANSSDTETATDPTGSVTLRVPAASFTPLLASVRALGTVTAQSTTGTDVTATYVDLDARITALRASKSTYLAILGTAKTVQETISVQQRVDDVQSQIEQLTGQEKVLADQSDLATLTVTVGEVQPPPAPAPVQPAAPKPRGPWSQAVHTAGHSVLVVVRALIAASGVLGLLLMVLLGGLLAQRVVRQVRRRRAFSHSNG